MPQDGKTQVMIYFWLSFALVVIVMLRKSKRPMSGRKAIVVVALAGSIAGWVVSTGAIG